MRFLEKIGVVYSSILVVVVGLLVMATLLLIVPIVYVCFGFMGGLVVKWIFGGMITDGLNVLFNTSRFTPEMIPTLTAIFALIGSFFKNSKSSSNPK